MVRVALGKTGLFGACVMMLALSSPGWARCADLLPGAAQPTGPKRSITSLDLARLRDIGRPDGALLGGPSPLAVAPDQTRIAFNISRPDPASNSICVGLAVMDLVVGARPRLIDQGGEMILASGNVRGLITPIGYPAVITPSWSPDGRSIAYLRRDQGVTQLWAARAEGGMAHPLTQSPVDIEQFVWRADGKTLLYAARTGQLAERAADANAALTGYPYDDRFVPAMSPVPLPVATTPLSHYAVDIASLAVRPVRGDDSVELPPDRLNTPAPLPAAEAGDGRRAWTAHSSENILSPLRLQASLASGDPVACTVAACRGKLTGLWWMPQGGPLLFLRREGRDLGDLVLYRWQPGAGQPRAILRTSGVLDGCVLAQARDGLREHRVIVDGLAGGVLRALDGDGAGPARQRADHRQAEERGLGQRDQSPRDRGDQEQGIDEGVLVIGGDDQGPAGGQALAPHHLDPAVEDVEDDPREPAQEAVVRRQRRGRAHPHAAPVAARSSAARPVGPPPSTRARSPSPITKKAPRARMPRR